MKILVTEHINPSLSFANPRVASRYAKVYDHSLFPKKTQK